MDFTSIEAHPREAGKKAARAVRREGQVPCVLYGHNVEPVIFHVSGLSLDQLVRTDETSLVKIDLDGRSWECILKDVVFHPVTDFPMHADFQVLQAGERISLTVPFRFIGTPVGQIEGGNTQYVITDAEITCLPKDIPSHIDIDVTGLNIGDAVHISDLEIEGVEFEMPPSQTIVAVLAPRLQAVDEEEEGLLEAEEEGIEEEAEEGDED